MAQETIDKILESRRQSAQTAEETTPGEDKFFSILVGEVVTEHFLELKFRVGMRSCFSYDDLLWFNYDPDGGTLDLEFGGYFITIKGRGLGDRLFQGIKQKRVTWVQESENEMQDHPGNKVYISEITIVPPDSPAVEEAEQ